MDWTVRPHGYVSPPPAPPSPDRASASGSSGSPDSVDTSEGVEMGVEEVEKPEVETTDATWNQVSRMVWPAAS